MAVFHEASDLMKAALLGPVKKTVFPLASGVSLIPISPLTGHFLVNIQGNDPLCVCAHSE